MTDRNHRMLRAGVLVLVFVLAGLGAAAAEWLRERRAARWSASAKILCPEEWFRIVRGGQSTSPPLDPHTVVEEALEALEPNRQGESLRTGEQLGPGRRLHPIPPSGSESARMDLRATVATEERPDGQVVRIDFRYAASSPDRAVRELNAIVGAYAARLQIALAREVLRLSTSVRSTDDGFRRELTAAGPELDRLIDRAVRAAGYRTAPRDAAQDAEKMRKSPFCEEPTGETGPIPESSQQTAARSELEELRQRRAKLLLDRTPAHPDVRQVEAQIAEAEKRLDEVPAEAARAAGDAPRGRPTQAIERAPDSKDLLSPAPASTLPNPVPWTELFQALQSLQGRIEQVARELERSGRRTIPGSQFLLRGDGVEIQWAQRAQMTADATEWRALAVVALAAGLVTSAGMAMVWRGARIDPPVTSRENIERGLALPVIGAIATDQVLPESTLTRSARVRWRWPCIAGGLVVLAAYFVFLLQPFLAC